MPTLATEVITSTSTALDSSSPSSWDGGRTLASLQFPPHALVGSLGDLARALAEGTEVPEEFYFACALPLFGAMASTKLTLNVSFEVDTRLYTILLGESYTVKKSTAMKEAIKFFTNRIYSSDTFTAINPKIHYGAASAEGLIREMTEGYDEDTHKHSILSYDELRALIDKCNVKGSTLLPMVTSLFEQTHWDNPTKSKHHSTKLRNAHLSLIGCCTLDTYAQVWTRDAIAIGLPNRLFLMNADRRVKVSWPTPPDERILAPIADKIKLQLKSLPKCLSMDAGGKEVWNEWYQNIPPSEHARRLDTIGFWLLAIIAHTMDKKEIDREVVEVVTTILNYELGIRTVSDPIDADNRIAALEESIRRNLKV